MRTKKFSSEMLQNLLHFMYKKTHVVFFVFHFVQASFFLKSVQTVPRLEFLFDSTQNRAYKLPIYSYRGHQMNVWYISRYVEAHIDYSRDEAGPSLNIKYQAWAKLKLRSFYKYWAQYNKYKSRPKGFGQKFPIMVNDSE